MLRLGVWIMDLELKPRPWLPGKLKSGEREDKKLPVGVAGNWKKANGDKNIQAKLISPSWRARGHFFFQIYSHRTHRFHTANNVQKHPQAAESFYKIRFIKPDYEQPESGFYGDRMKWKGEETKQASIIKTTHEPSRSCRRKEGGRSWAACLSISITRLRVREGMALSSNHTHGSWCCMVQASVVWIQI